MYPVIHGAIYSIDRCVIKLSIVLGRLNCVLRRRQLLKSDPSQLTGLSADRSSAPVGIDPTCGIPLVNKDGSLGNIANIIACGLSMLVVAWLVLSTGRRKAAVGERFISLPLPTPLHVSRVKSAPQFAVRRLLRLCAVVTPCCIAN